MSPVMIKKVRQGLHFIIFGVQSIEVKARYCGKGWYTSFVTDYIARGIVWFILSGNFCDFKFCSQIKEAFII